MDAQVKERRDGPELFTGVALEVGAMQDCSDNIAAQMRSLHRCIEHKQKIPAKHCAEDLAKAAHQLKTLADHLASVITRNVGASVRSPS